MKVIIERSPKKWQRREMAQILDVIFNEGVELSHKLSYLNDFYGSRWFFYEGGSHIAIHPRNNEGEPEDERLLIIEK